MIPLLPFYAEKLGATPAQVGLLIGVYAACQLVSGPLLGRLSDRTGRKPLLLVSQAGTLIGFLIMAFAPNLWIMLHKFGANAMMRNPISVPAWLTSSSGLRPVRSESRPSRGPETSWQAA